MVLEFDLFGDLIGSNHGHLPFAFVFLHTRGDGRYGIGLEMREFGILEADDGAELILDPQNHILGFQGLEGGVLHNYLGADFLDFLNPNLVITHFP